MMASQVLLSFLVILPAVLAWMDPETKEIGYQWKYVSAKMLTCMEDCEWSQSCSTHVQMMEKIKSQPEQCATCIAKLCTDASSPFFAECLAYAAAKCISECIGSKSFLEEVTACGQCRSHCIDARIRNKILHTSKCLKKCHHYYECEDEPSPFCNQAIYETCYKRGLNCYFYARAYHKDVCPEMGNFEDFKKTVKCKRCYTRKCEIGVTGGPTIYYMEHKPLVHYGNEQPPLSYN